MELSGKTCVKTGTRTNTGWKSEGKEVTRKVIPNVEGLGPISPDQGLVIWRWENRGNDSQEDDSRPRDTDLSK